MHHPRSLAVATHDYILVADRDNHRILALNPSFTVACPLPFPVGTGLKCPREILLDQSRQQLYIGESAGLNRLLIFENVANIGALFVS